MTMILQLAVHLFLLLLWTRVCVRPDREFYFNPFLSGTTRLMDRVIGFLRPALGLPERMTALVLLVFFWIFQTLFFVKFGKVWQLPFGLIQFTAPGESLAWGMQFAYSGFRSAQFLLQVWTLYFFVQLITLPSSRATRAQEAFAFFMNPFSRLPLLVQPCVLLALHFALIFAIVRTDATTAYAMDDIMLKEMKAMPGVFTGVPLAVQLVKVVWLTVMSFTNGLQTLIWALIFFICGGLASMLFGANLPTIICRESVDVLLGRFARKSVPAGGLDFTPMFFIIIVSLVSGHLQVTLFNLIVAPLASP